MTASRNSLREKECPGLSASKSLPICTQSLVLEVLAGFPQAAGKRRENGVEKVPVKIIEEMSKNGIEWIRFSERYKPESTVLILDENYHFAKIARILQDYIFWRTKIEESK